MKALQALVCACAVLVITGCGGGGGGKGKSSQAAPASVTVSISTSAIQADVIIGDDYKAAVSGTWTSANVGSNQVYLQISDSAGHFTMPGTQLAGGSSFQYSLPLASNVTAGTRFGTFTVRACRDAQCAQPYTNANSSATVNYQLQVIEPTVTVAITTPAIVETVDPGDRYRTPVAGTLTAVNLGSNKIYLQVSDNAGTFAAPAPQLATPGAYNLSLPLADGLPTSTRSGLITVRACRDAMCTQPYKDAMTSIGYQLQFVRIAEWETHQRNAAHDGYVPITLDPSKFTKAWEWQNSAPPGWFAGINAVVTSNGTVYLGTDAAGSEAKLYALNEATGQQRWGVSLGVQHQLNPPATHDGILYAATTGHETTYLWAFDTVDGAFKFKSPFSVQWSAVMAPTIYDDQVYTNGGYYGGYIYAYDRLNGGSRWVGMSGGDDDMATPAADESYVYYHNGKALVMWDRKTGEKIATIADPFATNWGYSYHGSPILGGRNNVVAFAGDAFSGRGNASAEHYDQRVLSSFNIGTKTWEWATRDAYLTHPAVAKGVIYAARNRPNYLDAIDEATGQVLWSWSPLPEQGDTEFHRNIIVTRNLVFVSTNLAVYAIDLATHKPVWRYPVPGMLAISSNRTLYIVQGATETTGKLIAIKLN